MPILTEPTLDNLPDDVFVALGRRGMEPVPLKECTYECDGKELDLLRYISNLDSLKKKGMEELEEDYVVKCSKCNREFTIRCLSRLVDGERMDTRVNILDDKGKDLGWLGSY